MKLTKEMRLYFKKIGKMGGEVGGHARALALTPARRKEIARLGALAKWAKNKA